MFGLKPKKTLIGSGYCYDSGEETEISILDDDRKGHFWCFGTTRVGKTRLMENMVEQDIRKGYNVVIIDPKNDIEFFSKVVQVATETRRLDDLSLMTSIFPQYSCTLNPLEYYYMNEEIIAHTLAGMEVGKEPFYYNIATEISNAVVYALLCLRRHNSQDTKLNFSDIESMVAHSKLEELLMEVQAVGTSESEHIANSLTRLVQLKSDYYDKISSGFSSTLQALTTGNTGHILGNARGNKVMERLESGKGVIFVAQVGSLLTDKVAATVSRVLISMLKSLAGRTFASGKTLRPLAIYADEAQNVLFDGFEDLVAKVGGANMMFHGFCQSISQINTAMGDADKGSSILDNINTKIFMRAPDQRTAEYAAKHFGEIKQMSPVFSVGSSPTMREVEENLVKPEHILALQVQEFYMLSLGKNYKGRTAKVSGSKLRIEYPEAGVQ